MALRLHDPLTAIAEKHQARLKIVELPPGPPVLSSLVAEVYGRPDHSYADLIAAAGTVADRLRKEPGVVEVDDTVEAPAPKLVFVTDQEKAALNGVSVDEIARTLQVSLSGASAGTVRLAGERNPLAIELRLPGRSAPARKTSAGIRVKGRTGNTAARGARPVGDARVDQTIYHKNLERVVYVFAETAGRPPAECVLDVTFDRRPGGDRRHRLGRRHASPGRSPSATISRTAAASPGPCPKGCASSSPARASGRSPSTSSATSAWPSARRW